jgi:hypothetical protein
MLCELPLVPELFRLQTAVAMRIMKGGVRLKKRRLRWSSECDLHDIFPKFARRQPVYISM